MAKNVADESGDKKMGQSEGSFMKGTRVTAQLLKNRSGEFDLDSIFLLSLPQEDIDDLGAIGSCSCLQRLDISRNDLTDLKPLTPLKQLSSLNISANRITNLDPLKELESLKSLNAAGNLIGSFETIFCLSTLKNLEDLRFQDPLLGWGNPICNNTNYRSTMTSHFCELKTLDGERMCGKGSDVFTSMRQLDRALAKCDEPSSNHISNKESSSWVEKGFWDSGCSQKKEQSDITEAERQFRELLSDCRTLNRVALHNIQTS